MRISALIVACGVAAALTFPADRAFGYDERNSLVVLGNHGTTQDRVFAYQLGLRLRRFATDVWERSSRRGDRTDFTVLMGSELDPGTAYLPAAADRIWKDDTIAVMVGTIGPGSRESFIPEGAIYLGRPVVATLPRARDSWFDEVSGRFRPGADARRSELDAYEIIIGYALLRRAWQNREAARVGAIAQVLRSRIDAAERQPSYGSWDACLRLIRESSTAIMRAPLPPPRPPRARSEGARLHPISCR